MFDTLRIIDNLRESVWPRFEFGSDRILLTGEGSSRIFPAKHTIAQSLRDGANLRIVTEGAAQAAEYDLTDYHVFVASNSGRTAEGLRLLRTLRRRGNPQRRLTSVTAFPDSPIATTADDAALLACGTENAVAATKSAMEQALFYESLYRRHLGKSPVVPEPLCAMLEQCLQLEIPADAVSAATRAGVFYFAGRNNGVAEELALKASEVTRKKSVFLEGTHAVHGVEETMDPEDIAVLVDPFPEEEEKFEDVLSKGVGLRVFAIADRRTRFPTIRVPSSRDYLPYLQLAAGWNLLVEAGLAMGLDLDTPLRARKVGNEFLG
jgi:glucosamine--fructose-6-phosphate aminotransferase (isomerizing)